MATATRAIQPDRILARRAALIMSLRSGDLPSVARAAARLRMPGVEIPDRETAVARDAQLRLGRAIRQARLRRGIAQPYRPVGDVLLLRVPRRPWLRAFAPAVAIVAALVVLLIGATYREGPPAAAAPELVTEQTAVTTAAPGGRGRTTAVVTVIEPEPTAAPTPAPSAAPAAATAVPKTAAPAGSPVAGARPGGVPGGVTGGVVGGVVGGTVGGSTPRPTPGPTFNTVPLAPAALAAGYDRFTFRVVDSRTLRSLSGVCVILGTQDCGIDRPHTNTSGNWYLDIPRSNAAKFWSFGFEMSRYFNSTTQITYTPGQSRTIEVRLRSR